MGKFDQITYFIAVVEEHGFAAAARKFGVSTAAVSRQIARLEAELKAELLVRTTRKLSLTDIGARYYQQCKKTLLELNEAEIAIANSRNEAVGILNVTSSRYFAMRFLLPYLPEFMELNPKLQIKIELAERFPDLAQENVDVLFGVSMEGPLNWCASEFLQHGMCFAHRRIIWQKMVFPKHLPNLGSTVISLTACEILIIWLHLKTMSRFMLNLCYGSMIVVPCVSAPYLGWELSNYMNT